MAGPCLRPGAVRARYRERLLRFHLDTLPRYKHGLQSRIYRFIAERQRLGRERKKDKGRIVDLVRRQLLGSEGTGAGSVPGGTQDIQGTGTGSAAAGRGGGAGHEHDKLRKGVEGRASAVASAAAAGAVAHGASRGKMQSHYGGASGFGYGAYGTGPRAAPPPPDRGSRRQRLAAVAGSVYRAGVAAASELKEQYSNTRMRGVDMSGPQVSIPGAFPQVSIVTKGEEQMVLFPTYAKRHVREFGGSQGGVPPGTSFQAANAAQMGMTEEEYWKQEWARLEDEKAVVDVDVRGWIYMPNKGPMTRRNRILVGLARRLSGIPAPVAHSDPAANSNELSEEMKEQQRIAQEARKIERRGQEEKEMAIRGAYSESPSGSKGKNHDRVSPPPSPTLSARTSSMSQADMTEAELALANANLMARLGPFMTTPLVQVPISIFFYNDEQSRSHTVSTDDSGHFSARVALDFVPTNVRVLANDISTIKPVQVIESRGVSLISDVDDTVKHSNIGMGTREIFRNTFVRDLADLTIEGVREWYHRMQDLGVMVHYVSNSPWQLFPVLATFFHTAGLPPGSIHLKQYSGMLQGIFEPVAERKKGTLERIIRDFPERKFLLVGDSGEADLEVYTELVQANPGRILAVFIRDVTTPDQTGFFDSSFTIDSAQRSRQGSIQGRLENIQVDDESEKRPQLPPRSTTGPTLSPGPAMGLLIDLDEPEHVSSPTERRNPSGPESTPYSGKPCTPGSDSLPRKPPPPRPAKPAALRSNLSDTSTNTQRSHPSGPESGPGLPRPQTSAGTPPPNTSKPTPPPPPPPRRRGTAPTTQSQQQQQQRSAANNTSFSDFAGIDPLPAVAGAYPGSSNITETATPPNGPATAPVAIANKKVDLWLRRLARAHEILDAQGVKLYTWRRGDDVVTEAEGIVREAMRETGMGVRD
ncbi:actin patch protein 1 [Parathielavia appendiculata]|uniref:Actin patch protein 1 n=1 Tax=Parathielavia appendiculata TaxID=2587402 RepID=A0AAN6Z370_9PEZI|nr:actin patch protein 1 [Parathielavia appendiculata]